MTFRDQLQPQKMRFNGVWWYLEIIDLWDSGCDWDEAGELIVFCGRQWYGQQRPNHTWLRFCEISKLLSLKHKSLLFFLFFTSALKLVPFFCQHISMTCGCRSSTRTCSTEVSLYRLKKSRDSIDFRSALSLSLLFWRTASNQDRSLIYLWHMVLGQQRHLALVTFEGRLDLTHYKKPPPSHSNNSLSAICKE